MTVIATFIPKAWVGSTAVAIKDQAPVSFDVTPEIESMGKEYALSIKDDGNSSDVLQFSGRAPKWVRHWTGPFSIVVAQSIAEHYQTQPSYQAA